MTPGDRTVALRAPRRISLLRGVRRDVLVGWLFVLPALGMYAVFVLQPLALTIQYSLYRWDGVGPATWVGLANYATVLSDPDMLETIFNAFRLVIFFSYAGPRSRARMAQIAAEEPPPSTPSPA